MILLCIRLRPLAHRKQRHRGTSHEFSLPRVYARLSHLSFILHPHRGLASPKAASQGRFYFGCAPSLSQSFVLAHPLKQVHLYCEVGGGYKGCRGDFKRTRFDSLSAQEKLVPPRDLHSIWSHLRSYPFISPHKSSD